MTRGDQFLMEIDGPGGPLVAGGHLFCDTPIKSIVLILYWGSSTVGIRAYHECTSLTAPDWQECIVCVVEAFKPHGRKRIVHAQVLCQIQG